MIGEIEEFRAKDRAQALAEAEVALQARVPACQAWTGDDVAAFIAGDAVSALRVIVDRRGDEGARIKRVVGVALAAG